MRAPFGDPLEDEDQEADLEAQRAAIDSLLAPPTTVTAPAVSIEKAPGYGSGLNGAALAKAQDESAHNKWERDTGAGIYSTFARTPRPKMEARDPAAELLQQRQGMDQEGLLKEKQATRAAKLAQEAEWQNPDSDGNRTLREAIKASGLAPELVNSPQFTRMTKPRIEAAYGPGIAGKFLLMSARLRATPKSGKQPMDPNELAAARAQASKLHPEIDFSQMSFETMKPFLTAANARDTAAATVTASNTAARREADRHDRDLADKVRLERESVQIPGLEIAPGAHPSADDAKKVKASLASKERMGAAVNELIALHKEHGTELYGPTSARMQQLYKEILIEGKNIAELGALSGPDMGLIEDLIGADPGSVGANVKGLFGSDNTQARLKGLQDWTRSTSEGNAKSYGYQPAGGQGSQRPPVLMLKGKALHLQPDGTYE